MLICEITLKTKKQDLLRTKQHISRKFCTGGSKQMRVACKKFIYIGAVSACYCKMFRALTFLSTQSIKASMNSRMVSYLAGTLEQERLIREFILCDTQSGQDSRHGH